MNDELFFDETFHALIGHDPFPWQSAMYRRLAEGRSRDSCDIPTGLGKTAIIPIWLIALANYLDRPDVSPRVPRRLIYVVNRRTVVDQASDEALLMRHRFASPDLAPRDRARLDRLQQMLGPSAAVDPTDKAKAFPFGVSTLRGQFADNAEWRVDPCRPAIIVGTVDMIGSRLLFSGYGLGFKSKPLHAGFLGQDALLVHDEAHLEPAFQDLVESIQDEQARESAPLGEGMRLRLMALTATPRAGGSGAGGAFGLTPEDRADPIIQRRIHAKKAIELIPYEDPKVLPDKLAERALLHLGSNRAVLVFARSVEVAGKVAEKLRKTTPNVVSLTGTLRGKERDELAENALFRRFLPGAMAGKETVYLVSTSAGEVGVNLSADHMVCDLSTFESMAQRLGRVNRFGGRDDTRVDILHPEKFDRKDPLDQPRENTLNLLRRLGGDGSPDALSLVALRDHAQVFAEPPEILPKSDILFDAWALTTIRDRLPGRPPVEPYLRGVTDEDRPETRVAWREEVSELKALWMDDPERAKKERAKLLEIYPLKPHEVLRDRSDRVFKEIATLAGRYPDQPTWLVAEDGSVESLTLGDLANNKEQRGRLENRTILLPPCVGGLDGGLLNGGSDRADDVSDEWLDEDGKKRRERAWDGQTASDGMRLIRTIDARPDADEQEEIEFGTEGEADDRGAANRRYWNWYELPKAADNEGSEDAQGPVLWKDHTADVVREAKAIVGRLPLPVSIRKALILAADWHDLGKLRELFQRELGNRNLAAPLAKSGRKRRPFGLLGDYRHEFGSLLDLEGQREFQALDDELKDLVRHLITAHHGRGRPHFPAEEAFDPGSNGKATGEAAIEVPTRFARLQRKFGRWGLAYLESILRAADYAASAAPSRTLPSKSPEDRP